MRVKPIIATFRRDRPGDRTSDAKTTSTPCFQVIGIVIECVIQALTVWDAMHNTAISLYKRRVARLVDYGKVSIRNPKLFFAATRQVLKRQRREAINVMNAAVTKRSLADGKMIDTSSEELIDALAKEMGVLYLGKVGKWDSIGVADVNFLTALRMLRAQASRSAIAVKLKRVQEDAPNFERSVRTANSVEVTFSAVDGGRNVISIEAYQMRSPTEWVSRNVKNTQLRALRNDKLTKPGLIDVRDILGGKTLNRIRNDTPIDVVYTWVDHSDPEWAAMFAEHKGISNSKTDAAALSRFHSNDELRYSLRSVWQNAPWINKIYILTNCAHPAWLADDDPQLTWVDHSDAIPAEHLPTFNSHVIESCLHRIPDLSDSFLYLNDDVFLAKPVTKSFFFDASGASHSFLEPYGMVSGEVSHGDPDYLNASRNVARILKKELGFIPTQLHQHTAFALRRSVLAEMESRWAESFAALRKRKFRTPGDINVTSFLYHHYAIFGGQAREIKINNAFVKSLDVRWRDKLKDAKNSRYDTFCINEGGSEEPASDWHPSVRAFLEERFPKKAPWEKD